MSSLELFAFVLGLVWLPIVPLVLAAYGGHLGAKALTDPNARRFAIFVFWGLCVLGIAIAIVYQYRTRKIDEAREFKSERTEAERQRKLDEAQRHAMETQA